MPGMQELRRQRQEDLPFSNHPDLCSEFQASKGYTVRPCQKTNIDKQVKSKEEEEQPPAPVLGMVQETYGYGKDKEGQICGSVQRAHSTSYQVSRENKPGQYETIKSAFWQKPPFPNVLMTAGSNPPIFDSNKYSYLGRENRE